MSKSKPIELFSLKALAAKENISYAHMKRLMMDIAKQDPAVWKGWNFLAVGPEARKTWLAYRGKPGDVRFCNEPKSDN
jgi:hypothetical protein